MKFQCAGITDSIIDGNGISLVIWFSGCNIRCEKCHNPELQDSNYGYQESTEHIIQLIKDNELFYDSVVFLGGEPLLQADVVYEIAKNINITKWLYTGFHVIDIPSKIKEVCNVIVAGPYIDELKTNGFPASYNQKIIYNGEIINANRDQLRERIRTTL